MIDYEKHYNKLISRARANGKWIRGYTERHHIIPRCMGGQMKPENLVHLTIREHFVAHILLAKMYPDQPLLWIAASVMGGKVNVNPEKPTNKRIYTWLRRKHKALGNNPKAQEPLAVAIKSLKKFKKLEAHKALMEIHRKRKLRKKTAHEKLMAKQGEKNDKKAQTN